MNPPTTTEHSAADHAVAENSIQRVLVLEMVRVTEAAAIAAAQLIGRGDEKAADAAAVEAMRRAFDNLYIDGTVVIGEGERDEAPMLFIGEKVGMGKGPQIDIALDPLEGTTITAKGGPNALAVIAMAEEMGLGEGEMAKAMLASGLIGVFIATRWTFAAEVGGCQAEGGSAACMAAAALVDMAGGKLVQSVAAASMALSVWLP
jgi:hypothetical protein